MNDTIDEIKANLPIETTAAYAGIKALADNGGGNASYIPLMALVFFILLGFTLWLTTLRKKTVGGLVLSAIGYIVWVANIDLNRFSILLSDVYMQVIVGPLGAPPSFTESLHIILPATAIIYSVLLTTISLNVAKSSDR